MSHDEIDQGPQTETEFSDSLQRLVRSAQRNGVDVEGGWALQDDPDLSDVDIHVTAVVGSTDGESRF